MIENIDFIRPFWLLSVFPMGFIWWFFIYKNRARSNWEAVVDKHLLLRLSEQQFGNKPRGNLLLTLLLLSIFALSGPSFFKKNIPIYQQQKIILIMLDASPSMNATDVTPSRLDRAILLVKQLLEQNQAQTMLMVFAAEPYLISPPSADDKPILNLLEGFSTNILPAPGSRLDLALEYANDLLKEQENGNILLLTDAQNISANTFKIAEKMPAEVSIITIANKPNVEFKHNGKTQTTQTNKHLLKLLAQKTGGLYQQLNVNNIKNFLDFNKFSDLNNKSKKQGQKISVTIDNGIYFVLAVLPLFLLLFRRGTK